MDNTETIGFIIIAVMFFILGAGWGTMVTSNYFVKEIKKIYKELDEQRRNFK